MLAKVSLVQQKHENVDQLLAKAILINSGVDILEENWDDTLPQAPLHSYRHLLRSLDLLYQFILDAPNENDPLMVVDVTLDILQEKTQTLYTERDKLRVLEQVILWAERGIALAQDNVQKAFNYTEIARATLLRESIQNKYAYSFGNIPDSLRLIEQNLLQERDQINATIREASNLEAKDSLLLVLNDINRNLGEWEKRDRVTIP